MEDLKEILTPLLEGTDVPSLAAAVIVGSETRAAGAVGVRKRGDDTPVTVNEKYHIGSCVKAMTATLAGVLVERGVLIWEIRLREVFPDVAMHPVCEAITLRHLLSHSSGLAAFTNPEAEDPELVKTIFSTSGTPMEGRLEVVSAVLDREPLSPPGTTFSYSNMGYATAATMFEKLTQTSFESLLESEVFGPLGLSAAGFGVPGTPGKVDQPYGHSPEPVEPGPDADMPLLLAPAGTVHMSILDFAKHAAFHLTGKPGLVSRETLELLHTPVGDVYALGWGVVETEWAGGRALTHGGSNGMSHSVIGVLPIKNLAVVAACNFGTDAGAEVCSAAFKTLIGAYNA